MKKTVLPTNKSGSSPAADWYPTVLILVLVFLVFIAYHSMLSGDFVLLNWDDNYYVSLNPFITAPLTGQTVWEMFTKPVGNTYCGIPQLTWWYDYHTFSGINTVHIPGTPPDARPAWVAAAFDRTNLIFHAANTVLVFLIFLLICKRLRYTKNSSLLIAFATAFLFGLHPQHVESVAWVTERKDLTYSFFFLLAIYFWLSIADNRRRIVLTAIFFVLSLLSKGQAVTLVPTLFLLDYLLGAKKDLKIYFSFLALAVVLGIITLSGERKVIHFAGTFADIWRRTLLVAPYAFWGYIQRFVIPLSFSAFYQYPSALMGKNISTIMYIFPLLTVAAAIGLWYQRQNKIVLFGALFFVVNIALLLQIIPFGSAIMADRYTYIATIGLSFIAAVGLNYAWHYSHRLTIAAGIPVALLLLYSTGKRCEIWKNDSSLWRDAIAQNNENSRAYGELAMYYNVACHLADSAYIYTKKAIAAGSVDPKVIILYTTYFIENHSPDSALMECNAFFNSRPRFDNTRDSFLLLQNRGIAYNLLNRDSEAINDLRKSLEYPLPPNFQIRSLNYMGASYEKENQIDSAIVAFKRSYEIEPHSYLQFNITNYYLRLHDTASARQHFNIALKCSDVSTMNKASIDILARQLRN